MIGLFSLTILGPVITIGSFYLHQDEIEALYCENKDKPELNCKGHCYLEKQIKQESSDLKINQYALQNHIGFFWTHTFDALYKPVIVRFTTQSKVFSPYLLNYHRLVIDPFFDPPQA